MTEIGEFEFSIYDEWGSGIPITDSMTAIITSGMTLMSIMALIRDLLSEVIE